MIIPNFKVKSATTNSVTLQWDKCEGEVGYFVERYKTGSWCNIAAVYYTHLLPVCERIALTVGNRSCNLWNVGNIYFLSDAHFQAVHRIA